MTKQHEEIRQKIVATNLLKNKIISVFKNFLFLLRNGSIKSSLKLIFSPPYGISVYNCNSNRFYQNF